MCGRYTLRRPGLLKKLVHQEGFEEFSETGLVPRFNVAPSQHISVVRLNKEGNPRLSTIRWGLIPSWRRSKPKVQPINARSESVGASRMFRQAFERRRCLVPCDGFYEWQVQPDGTKQPHFIHFADDRIFCFAGIWERWKSEDGQVLDTAALLTAAPNELMKPIHNRMPVILSPESHEAWMDRRTSAEALQAFLTPWPDDEQLEAYPVSRKVNSPKNDEPDVIAREGTNGTPDS